MKALKLSDAPLMQIFGVEDMGKLMRIHLARLLPDSTIKIHKDHGGYTAKVGPLELF